MKTDVVNVKNSGEGFDTALQAASFAALYRGLDKKNSIRLRLLAEEMLGMIRQITGETEADFWVESEGMSFELHLITHPSVTGKMRKELLGASTSGKNEAAAGVMGKIRDVIDRALEEDENMVMPDYYTDGLYMPSEMELVDPMMHSATIGMLNWSMRSYMNAVEEKNPNSAEWDELEKSIVANIADDIKIAIAGNKVEMTAYKKFDK